MDDIFKLSRILKDPDVKETKEKEDYRDPIEAPNKKIPRNAICPLCDSGKKYKHCCGKY